MKTTLLFLLLIISGTAVAHATDYSCALPEGEFGLVAFSNFDLVVRGDSYVVINNVGQQLGMLEAKTEEGLRYWQSADRTFTLLRRQDGTAHFYAGQFFLCEEI